MRFKFLLYLLVGACTLFYLGMFLGDLGGVGGYDGIAPKWLFDKVNHQPGNETLFTVSEYGSIIFLSVGFLTFSIFIVLLIFSIFNRIKRRKVNS